MKSVKIAELKSRLSEYLRAVRRGEVITVVDRETPVARIIPFEGGSTPLVVRGPSAGSLPLRRVPLPPPLSLPRRLDIVDLLLEERQGSR
ncbi:MAG: type II toxin-antitoxin system prevent-host-death family antitoxin [Acidobacteria bacterium]|nr:type II toxin-antitoxin system prevent-host-death family antitoxin [Acidobacteriota bacterium]